MIPARVENDREETIDIGDKYYYYLSREIEILCQNIENLAEYETLNQISMRSSNNLAELSLQKMSNELFKMNLN
ncbi:hypothetical protein MASR2M39_25730 [Ignavibacteriales bacterium]